MTVRGLTAANHGPGGCLWLTAANHARPHRTPPKLARPEPNNPDRPAHYLVVHWDNRIWW